MSKSILKSNWVTMKPGETRVIDSNALIEEKLKSQAEMFFQPDAVNEPDMDGFIPGLAGVEYEEIPGMEDMPVEPVEEQVDVSSQTQMILEEAQAQVENLKQQALQEIELERQRVVEEGRQLGFEQGYEEGKKAGFEEGRNEGIASIETQKEEMLRSLALKTAQNEEEFKERMDQLEPKMVETLTHIYEKVFQIELKNCKDLVVHLLASTMHNLEGIKSFLIHVAKEDYPLVSMQKKELIKDTNIPLENVDIVEDSTLKKGDCMIETENGIFDCSLGTQLETLNEQLILLSYKQDNEDERNN